MRHPTRQALRFSQGRGERLVMNRNGPWKGTKGRRSDVSPVVSFAPSFARTFSSRERRLGTRQQMRHIEIVYSVKKTKSTVSIRWPT